MKSVQALLLSLTAVSAVVSGESNIRYSPAGTTDGEMPSSQDTTNKNAELASLLVELQTQLQFQYRLKQLAATTGHNELDRYTPLNEESGRYNEESGRYNEESGRYNEESGRFNDEFTPFNKESAPFNKEPAPLSKEYAPVNDESAPLNKESARFNAMDDAVRVVAMKQQANDGALDRKTACLKAVERIHEKEELELRTASLMLYIRSTFDKVSLLVWGGASCEDLDRPELVEQCNLVLKSEDVVQKYLLEGKTDDQVCDIISTVTDLDPTDDFPCHLCQRFVQMVDRAISQDVQQVEHVQEIVGDLCKPADSLCRAFPDNFDAILRWVLIGVEPLDVCSRLTMCSADSP
ncbi:unnamed protein product [Peronospora belbahrii]|uniref:Saposin B-type domain-containing protein n=1 Tax=Peronospora belbahrii TaxID=622444 RepID=A0AAU9KNL7_9STRA|nr:unnamed protein product [Peronospora belbahrii]